MRVTPCVEENCETRRIVPRHDRSSCGSTLTISGRDTTRMGFLTRAGIDCSVEASRDRIDWLYASFQMDKQSRSLACLVSDCFQPPFGHDHVSAFSAHG